MESLTCGTCTQPPAVTSVMSVPGAHHLLSENLSTVSESYSFDLTYHANDHDTPLRSMEQGGTFEQSIKESEAVQDYSQDEKPQEGSPVANGHAVETDPTHGETEQTSSSEEDSFLSDTSLTPPMKKVEFNLDLDLIGRESELASSAPDDTSESQQNENNNNVTNAGNDMDVFTEINLDEAQ
ncbi:uncharacterized protein LOC143498966 isoform X3 [Brachyhypopomus gauderio]|uniref:uncharacterized protein LOC143498966 isoform X3 n=1 Tax=Brachyhypopomus gauderio TaxID=698409 RepID=UPI00404162BD